MPYPAVIADPKQPPSLKYCVRNDPPQYQATLVCVEISAFLQANKLPTLAELTYVA